jgi:hypothetical protein
LIEACGRIWAAFPLVAGKLLQKPASKSLLEMLKNTLKCQRNFLFLHRKFPHKNLQIKDIYDDLSKSVRMLKQR